MSPISVLSRIPYTRAGIFSSIGFDLPIVPAQIAGGKWEITKNGVSYLTTSPLPGSEGNSVLYGHN